MHKRMECRFIIYSLFMAIQNSFFFFFWISIIHFWIFKNGYPKIHFWISKKSVDYWISIIRFLDIQKLIMDILKYIPIFGYP